MNYIEKLESYIKQKNGTILTSDLVDLNIPRVYLSKLVEMGKLERVSRGVYVSPETIEDEMYYMQCKYPRIIYSHETALFIHNLTDRTPFEYSATVPSSYKVVKNISENFKIYYIKRDLHSLGIIDGITSFGNKIKVYNVERTICDIVRSRNKIDIQIVNEALKGYIKLKSTDYRLLLEYARKFRVEKLIKGYMEVLL
ncbi:type IV toxin-antitoxin system AbiEi family antitoxin domain-containing protein [Serpentinicella alkaliphila]|uniref:Putative transcriptional regulator of viral defense system n=1 Tax=Serpentinicella alkaliphila TaxID=1734049 RepID=A0A4R2T6U7_9FIRM|nr:type IV toxin-antitoxin system AbiEi family antitoxin domain-containing protein [Serpentinicella alkaliphila]QUH26412.1 type IV toxin-antitoxin system AbiEi family antitoxin domain-containing protein [Serpentinicella alkaliphila]TCP97855.1 putative transcriptional regulator of viral defense system [Serpentinicella alkaliphila]